MPCAWTVRVTVWLYPCISTIRSSRSDPTIEEQLTCPLCHKLFEDPKVLPCLHIVCKACIESFLSGRESRVHCPGCQTPVAILQNGASKLPTAFFIANMIEATVTLKKAHEPNTVCESCGSGNEAAVHCTDCASFLCKDCCLNHHLMKVLKEHKVTEIKDVDKSKLATKVVGSLCPKHTSGKLELYCCSCKSLVCYECVYLEHPKPQHLIKPVKEIVIPFKEDMKSAITSLVDCETELKVAMVTTSNRVTLLLEQENTMVQLIKELFGQIMPPLVRERDAALIKVQTVFTLVKGDLDLQLRNMEILQAHIRTVQSFVKYLDGHSCDEDFVFMKHLVCDRIGELREMCRELKEGPGKGRGRGRGGK